MSGSPGSETQADAPVMVVSKQQIARYFIIAGHKRTEHGFRSYRRGAADQALILVF
jgi:hypothetical protein